MIFLHFVLLLASFLRGAWCLPGQLSPSNAWSCPHPGESLTSEIACVQKCWENSRYVSKCPNETGCLCKDGIFQRVSVPLQWLIQKSDFPGGLAMSLLSVPDSSIRISSSPCSLQVLRLRDRNCLSFPSSASWARPSEEKQKDRGRHVRSRISPSHRLCSPSIRECFCHVKTSNKKRGKCWSREA